MRVRPFTIQGMGRHGVLAVRGPQSMRRWGAMFAVVVMGAGLVAAQQAAQKPAQPVPDAPSAARPIPKELPPVPAGSAQPRSSDSSSTTPPDVPPPPPSAAPPSAVQPYSPTPRPRNADDSGR